MPYDEGKERTIDVENSQDIFDLAKKELTIELTEKLTRQITEKLNDEFKKGKGRDVICTVFCTSCTLSFQIKRKNNKDDDTTKQLCPHLIFKSWKVK